MDEKDNLILKNLRAFRKDVLNLKTSKVADELKLSESTLRNYENGLNVMSLATLINYVNTFDGSLDYIFGIEDKNIKYSKINISKAELGANLRDLRKRNGKTLMFLEDKLKVDHSVFSKYETGTNMINTINLYSLTTVYDRFSIDKLFNREVIEEEEDPSHRSI